MDTVMKVLNANSSRSRAEANLLLALRFTCLLSKYDNVMQDPKVINRSVSLQQQLKTHGPSLAFKEKFIRDEAKSKYFGGDLDDHFSLTVSRDLGEILIYRTYVQRLPASAEVSHV